jgi:hypothetical protein
MRRFCIVLTASQVHKGGGIDVVVQTGRMSELLKSGTSWHRDKGILVSPTSSLRYDALIFCKSYARRLNPSRRNVAELKNRGLVRMAVRCSL